MKKNKLVPRLRFHEFKNSPSWDIKKFDFQFLPTNTFSRSEMNNNKGIVKNIHYGDILIKYNYILDNTSLIPFINEDINLNKFTKESYLQNGDIIIADTAEDFSAGKAIEVQNINCKVLSGQHTFLCRPQTKYAPKFLGYYLNSPLYHNYLTKFLTGTKVYSINKTNIKNTFIIYPDNLEEQKKIADCLASIDELIDAEKRKSEALKKYKKALTQKLFPAEDASIPELRFEEFKDSGEWENKKLGKLCNITTGKLDANAMVENGKYRFYTCAREYFYIDKYAFDMEALLISGNGSNVGYIHYFNGKFNAYQRTYVLYDFISNIHYIRYYLEKNLDKRIKIEKKEGNTPYIVLGTLTEMNIFIPKSIKEQKKIADCLASIDSIIDSQVKRIDNLIKHKKALMQGLFPDMESIEDYE